MAGLLPGLHGGDARLCRAGGEAGPEAAAGEVGLIDTRCPGSSGFRERLTKGKDQFLEFGFDYPFRSSHPGKPLRHALVHF
jgi:hypothetical protein